jgi:hypothetical protein
VRAARWGHFRRRLGGPVPTYGSLFAVALGIAVAAENRDLLGGMTAALAVLLLVMLAMWRQAGSEAEIEFFSALAPALGLRYVVSSILPPLTPLLAAGTRQTFEQAMEGPVFGSRGGPVCTLAHYTFRTIDQEGRERHGWRFTVCGMEIDGALPVFHGVYLRPRGGVVHDWLDRAPRPEEVHLESTDFDERYELRAALDQDRGVLHQLFSPSFVVWLTEHPLGAGFECKAGELVVYVPGHVLDPDRITLLHEASREIARRVAAAVEATRALTPAG